MRLLWVVLRKELAVELRTREVLHTSVFFALLLATTFMFGFFEGSRSQWEVGPGILWVGLIFAATIAFNRSFAREERDGCIAALRLIPGIRTQLLWGKVLANIVLLFAIEVVLVPAIGLFFHMPLLEILPGLLLLLILATVGLCALGTVLGAALVNFRLREVLLPLVLFPLVVPLLVAAVHATTALVRGDCIEMWDWIRLMVAFDAIYIVISGWLFGWILEATE